MIDPAADAGYEVHLPYSAEIGGRLKSSAGYQFFQLAVAYIGDVVPAFVDSSHLVFQQVESQGPETGPGDFHSQRKAYISQTYDSGIDSSFLYFLKQLLFHFETFFKQSAKIDLFMTSCHSRWNSLMFLIPG